MERCYSFFFFFQAEDGIRDKLVTGVQTCALPIFQPLVASSPFMFWLYKIFSLQAVSNLIGAVEIAVAALIALRPFSARLSFIGSMGAIITFVLTVSFLFSTPGAFQFSHGFLLLGDAGQFLIKDLVLLGASIWTAAEARKED